MQGIKEKLTLIKGEIKQSRIQEGLIVNCLFTIKSNLSHKEKGKNHLYDFIDEGTNSNDDFTEADLKEAEQADEDFFNSDIKVRSTPHRFSQKSKKTVLKDSLNPYTNPNLDSDLSTTIGRKKGTRI